MKIESRAVATFNSIGRWATAVCLLALAIVFGAAFVHTNNHWAMGIVIAIALLVVFLSAATMICAMLLRDLAVNNWRFSLRALLLTTTVVAAILGLIMYATRS